MEMLTQREVSAEKGLIIALYSRSTNDVMQNLLP